MLYCFLDTNIFLEYRMFDEIDWPKLLNATEVCLIVPKKVIQELDKHKNDPNSDRRRDRSRKVLRKLTDLTSTPESVVRPNTRLEMHTLAPKRTWLEQHDYDPEDNDDCIVGAAHYLKETYSDRHVMLFTGDHGPLLKAIAVQLPCMEAPDDLRLPPEPDPIQKELQETRRELDRLKNAKPKLTLQFEDAEGNYSQMIELPVSSRLIEATEDKLRIACESKLATLLYRETSVSEVGAVDIDNIEDVINRSISFYSAPSPHEIDSYNRSVRAYIAGPYRTYLRELNAYHNAVSRTHVLKLEISNVGTSPAKNVDLWCHFPDGFIMMYEEHEAPTEPHPPEHPNLMDSVYGRLNNYLENQQSILSQLAIPKTTGPFFSFRKTNSYELEWGPFGNLKHGYSEVRELYLYFDSLPKLPVGFEVDYRITADNLPDPVTGKQVCTISGVNGVSRKE